MLGSHDQSELLLPIFSGIVERPVWQTFLAALLARSGAAQVALFARTAMMAPNLHLHCSARREPGLATLSLQEFATLGLLQQNALRPGRVYALEELLAPQNPEQRAALAKRGIAYGRFLHVMTREDSHLWLVLAHDRSDFSASDSALLSSLGPPMTLALTMLAREESLQLRAKVAESALARIGITQTPLAADGRPLAGFSLPRTLEDNTALSYPLEIEGNVLPCPASTVHMTRLPPPDNRQAATQQIARELGISLREAALAEALSRGRSIIEAGADLRLTPETARNYTKRIYAKTGATGQADLVRRVLSGLAAFA